MTALPTVSLVIVSRDRPAELCRLLVSLRYLNYPNFEVVVVSNSDPKQDFPAVYNIENIKFVRCDAANISMARNMGIAASGGSIIAFCDDDAVPESSWLDYLTEPFSDPGVAAAGGYVRARNGISFQWKGRSFDRFGAHQELELDEVTPTIFSPSSRVNIKTEGTNCAFRKQVLIDLGGFDENFVYYLDETDLNARISIAGLKTALVPRAEVHHGFAASLIRRQDRAPKNLFEIGASKAWYLKKHGIAEEIYLELAKFRTAQEKRLVGFMVQGFLAPDQISGLLAGLDAGMKAGLQRQHKVYEFKNDQPGFQMINPAKKPGQNLAITSGYFNRRAAHETAKNKAASGLNITIFQFSLSSMFHKMEFVADGYWVQSGGLFGRSDRSDPLFQLTGFKSRMQKEISRLAGVRPLEVLRSGRDL